MRSGRVDQAVGVAAERRIELHRDHELARLEQACELGRLLRRLRQRIVPLLAGARRGAGGAVLVDGAADRGDLRRRRAAAAADQLRAERPCPCRELGEVLGGRVRERDARAGDRRQPDVRQGRERRSVAGHVGERVERRGRPAAVVRAERGQVELPQARAGVACRDAGHRHPVAVEAHQRHDRQARDGAHRLDRELQLEQVVERLEHHDIGAAALQDPRLLGERGAVVLSARPDRPADEDLAAGDLACLAGELHPGRVDLLEVVLEEVLGQLGSVRAERVRLDQLGPGVDEADVHRDDRVGGAQVRLLGAAQARHGGREHDSHAAVGDDRRPGAQAVGEAPGHGTERNQAMRSTTERGMDQAGPGI